MKKITFYILFLIGFVSYGQFNVSISNLTVNNSAASSVNFGANVNTLNVALTAIVTTTSPPSDSFPGEIKVYYKKNNLSPEISPNGDSGGLAFFLGNTTITRPMQFTLSASQFDNSGGVLYVQYKSYAGVIYKSSNIDITKNTSPPPSGGGSGNQSLAYIRNASPVAMPIPSGSVYIDGYDNPYATFEWQVKPLGGVWTTIPNETMWSCYNRNWTYQVSGTYRRIAKIERWWGLETIISNEVEIESITPPLQEISNNVITYSKENIIGSLPSGGNTYYAYEYYLYQYDGDGEIIEVYNVGNGKDFPIQISYNLITKIYRKVYSGNKVSYSNVITILPTQEITNNTLTLSGDNILGSLPSGGNGNFLYEYYSYIDLGNNEIEGPSMIGTEQHYMGGFKSPPAIKYYRRVVSGNKSSYSNIINFPLSKSSSNTETLLENRVKNLTVYPNPTSESINFATNFSTDKNIEIVLYSEKLGNEKSVYKGKVTPNQIINWSIPANYQKGLYFYKILSENKEVKSGKVLFN